MNRLLPKWARLLSAATLALSLSATAANEPNKPAPNEPKKDSPHPSPSLPDWKLEVIKEKPDIHLPSVVTTAPDGRIFVAEDPMDQFGPGNQPGDRVLCIHPDGKVTVFADKLYAVFGLSYYDGKLLIHHSPKFTVYRDENGVGKDPVNYYETDNPATWGGGSLNDHIPAQIRLGMDGFYYMSVGDKGIFGLVSNIDKSTAQLQGGGVIRFRPDGTNFEVYASGTRNHLDISMNAEDEIFSYDNTDDGNGWNTRFTHLVDGGFYGYPYHYRPHESDTEGLDAWKKTKDEMSKARHEYDKAMKDAKTDEERAKIKKPTTLVPPFRPYTTWAMDDLGGGSPCGATGYNEDALPEEFRGNLFHCEWGKGQVERFIVERTGATYRIVKRDDKFLKGGTQAFRPLGICVTPDGMGFYVCDWNWAGWNSKNDAGRLMKLTWTGKSLATPKPSWYIPAAMGQKFDATTAQLVEGLKHPAESVRLVAQRRIGERGSDAVPALVALLNDKSAPSFARWSAVWSLDRIDEGKVARREIIAVVGNPTADVSVRMQAARQLGTRKAPEAVGALMSALNDGDAALRFRAATALGRIGDAQAVPALVSKLNEPDLFARYAVFTALNRIGRASPAAWEPIVKALSADAPIRDGATYAMRDAYEVPLVHSLSLYVTDANNPVDGRIAAINALAPLVKEPKAWTGKWWGTQPVKNLPPAYEVEWQGTTTAAATLRKALEDSDPKVRAAAVKAHRIAPDQAVTDILINLFNNPSSDTKLRQDILRALAAAKSPAAKDLVAQILKTPAPNTELLPDALKLAASLGGDAMREALIGLISQDINADLLVQGIDTLAKMKDPKSVPALVKSTGHKDEKVSTAAINALGQITSKESFEALVKLIDDAQKPNTRRNALNALANHKNKSAIPALLALVANKDVNKEALNALSQTPDMKALDAYLDGLSNTDGTVRSNCRKAIQSIQKPALPVIEARLASNPLPTAAINELQQLYQKSVPEKERTGLLWKFDTKALKPEAFATFAKSHPGDARKGKDVFKNQNIGCIKCHKVGNEGADIGPALTGVGTKYDRAFLIESVLYPSKQILDGYQQTILRMKDGDVLSGVIKGETATEITLYDASATKTIVKKDEIKEREHGKLSLMPEGLQGVMKPEEFSDLIAYLESLK